MNRRWERGQKSMSRPGQKGVSTAAEKAKDTKGTVLRILAYMKPYRFKIFLAILMIIASTLFIIAATRLIGVAIDSYIMVFDFKGLAKISLIMLILYAFSSLFTWGQGVLMVQVAQLTVAKLRNEIFERFQHLPLKYFDSKTHGEFMSRITNDVDNISTTLNTSVSQILQSILTVVSVFVVMIVLSPILTLVSISTLPLLVLITKEITKRSRTYFTQRQVRLGELNGYIEETISGQKVVKVFTREEETINRFSKLNDNYLDVGIKAEIFSGSIAPLSNALNNLCYALIIGVGAIMILTGQAMTVGVISNFTIFSKQFLRPINELANQLNTILSAVAGAERVFDILDEPLEKADKEDAVELTNMRGDVVLNDVSFAYETGNPILKHINLYARPGQTIALVGPTGAGKTTIINLLTRFYDIDQGSITIDGNEIRNIKRDSLRSSLGVVLQDTYLFTGTIGDNIRYGKLDATKEELIVAAKLANAHEFICRLPHGYETELIDGGSNLSQGQRQMISIARAILFNPAILILDEATSSVDTRTEKKIQEAMNRLMKGRTNFVIAHRLSTIKDADMIAVVNHGEITERGNHKELLEKKGFYYGLYMSQFEEIKIVI